MLSSPSELARDHSAASQMVPCLSRSLTRSSCSSFLQSLTKTSPGSWTVSLQRLPPVGSKSLFEVRHRLASSLAREVRDLCSDPDLLISSCNSQSEQSQQHAIQFQHHSPVIPLPTLVLSFRAEHYDPFRFSRTNLLATVIDAKLHADRWYPSFSLQTASDDVLFTLSVVSLLKSLEIPSWTLQAHKNAAPTTPTFSLQELSY